MPNDALKYPITYLANVGAARAKQLKDGMGINTYGDLLMQFPVPGQAREPLFRDPVPLLPRERSPQVRERSPPLQQ